MLKNICLAALHKIDLFYNQEKVIKRTLRGLQGISEVYFFSSNLGRGR